MIHVTQKSNHPSTHQFIIYSMVKFICFILQDFISNQNNVGVEALFKTYFAHSNFKRCLDRTT